MLVHQLLKEHDFKERCAYCGKDFQNLNDPEIWRYGAKEYITLTCSSGHEHSFTLDISRALDAKLLHKEIENNKKIIVPKKHIHATIEEVVKK